MWWSAMPETVLHDLTSPGLLVTKRSSTVFSWVHSRWICSRWWSSSTSISVSQRVFLSLPGAIVLFSQSMSPALKSLPRMIGTSGSRLSNCSPSWLTESGARSLGGRYYAPMSVDLPPCSSNFPQTVYASVLETSASTAIMLSLCVVTS